MTDQTYIEALEQSAEKLDECIDMLSPAAGDHLIDIVNRSLRMAGGYISMAIAEEQLQRAVIAREHMQDIKREDRRE